MIRLNRRNFYFYFSLFHVNNLVNIFRRFSVVRRRQYLIERFLCIVKVLIILSFQATVLKVIEKKTHRFKQNYL